MILLKIFLLPYMKYININVYHNIVDINKFFVYDAR